MSENPPSDSMSPPENFEDNDQYDDSLIPVGDTEFRS